MIFIKEKCVVSFSILSVLPKGAATAAAVGFLYFTLYFDHVLDIVAGRVYFACFAIQEKKRAATAVLCAFCTPLRSTIAIISRKLTPQCIQLQYERFALGSRPLYRLYLPDPLRYLLLPDFFLFYSFKIANLITYFIYTKIK